MWALPLEPDVWRSDRLVCQGYIETTVARAQQKAAADRYDASPRLWTSSISLPVCAGSSGLQVPLGVSQTQRSETFVRSGRREPSRGHAMKSERGTERGRERAAGINAHCV